MVSIICAIQNNEQSYETIRNHIKSVSFKKNEIVLQAYEAGEYMYIIQEGIVKGYTISNSGDESITFVYGSQDAFPLSWISQSQLFQVYYQTITDCRMLLLPKNILLEQLKTNAEISFAMNQRILMQHEMYILSINNLEYKYGRERLAYRLLMLSSRFGENINGVIVLPRINQYNLAAMINISRESLSREMSRFEKHDILKYIKNRIVILNETSLLSEIGEDASFLLSRPYAT